MDLENKVQLFNEAITARINADFFKWHVWLSWKSRITDIGTALLSLLHHLHMKIMIQTLLRRKIPQEGKQVHGSESVLWSKEAEMNETNEYKQWTVNKKTTVLLRRHTQAFWIVASTSVSFYGNFSQHCFWQIKIGYKNQMNTCSLKSYIYVFWRWWHHQSNKWLFGTNLSFSILQQLMILTLSTDHL